jgi:hypothetical protein
MPSDFLKEGYFVEIRELLFVLCGFSSTTHL